MVSLEYPARVIPAFSRNMRRLRTRADLTQSQLATRSGVSKETINLYESGRHRNKRGPHASTVEAIARGLGCTPEQLLDESDFGWERGAAGVMRPVRKAPGE